MKFGWPGPPGGRRGSPGQVGHRGGIAVGVGQADRGDRPPAIVGVFRVPGDDPGVSHRDVDQSEHPGVLGHVVVLFQGRGQKAIWSKWTGGVPVDRSVVGPEDHRSGSPSAVLVVLFEGTQRLHLVERRRIRGCSRPGEAERNADAGLVIPNVLTWPHWDPRPPGRSRRRSPLTGRGPRDIGDARRGAVVSPPGEDALPHLKSDPDALQAGLGRGDRGQRLGHRGLELRRHVS